MGILKWLERQRDKLRGGPFRYLRNPGNFKVLYTDGRGSAWLSYSDCRNLRDVFGGVIVHRNQENRP